MYPVLWKCITSCVSRPVTCVWCPVEMIQFCSHTHINLKNSKIAPSKNFKNYNDQNFCPPKTAKKYHSASHSLWNLCSTKTQNNQTMIQTDRDNLPWYPNSHPPPFLCILPFPDYPTVTSAVTSASDCRCDRWTECFSLPTLTYRILFCHLYLPPSSEQLPQPIWTSQAYCQGTDQVTESFLFHAIRLLQVYCAGASRAAGLHLSKEMHPCNWNLV